MRQERELGAARLVVAGLGAALVALLLLALVPQPASAAPRRVPPPRADLAIGDTSFSREYAFTGEVPNAVRFCDRTTNRGAGSTGRRVHTRIVLRGPGGAEHVIAQRDIPKLRGRVKDPRTGLLRYTSHGGCIRGEGVLSAAPGAYDLVFCTDRRLPDANPRNNCVVYRRAFFVAKRTWTGNASGSGYYDINQVPEGETWLATGLAFTFDAAQYRRGVFTYPLTAGNISYKTAAGANGCDRTGAAVDGSPQGRLVLDYLNNTYLAFGSRNPAFYYVVTDSCQPDSPGRSPQHPIFIDSGIGAAPRALPFGTTQIADRRTEDNGTILTWSLQ